MLVLMSAYFLDGKLTLVGVGQQQGRREHLSLVLLVQVGAHVHALTTAGQHDCCESDSLSDRGVVPGIRSEHAPQLGNTRPITTEEDVARERSANILLNLRHHRTLVVLVNREDLSILAGHEEVSGTRALGPHVAAVGHRYALAHKTQERLVLFGALGCPG